MAKSTNGLGLFSGKVGAVVYTVSHGNQSVRAYQPIVANPKSAAQRLQRAKGNLIGQISKITPWQMLVGLGDNRQERRARFLQLLLRYADAQFIDGNVSSASAKLTPPNFKFSEGVVLPVLQIASVSAAVQSIVVNVAAMQGASDADLAAGGALVVVTVMQNSGIYEAVYYKFVAASDLSDGSLTVEFPHIREGAYIANSYIAPFTTSDGKSLRAVAGDLIGSAGDFSAALDYNPSAVPLRFGASVYDRTTNYVPSSAASSLSEPMVIAEPVVKAKKK